MENLENKKKYEQLKKMDKKYSIISILFFIPSIFFGLIELVCLINLADGGQYLPALVLNSIIFIPLIIAFLYFYKKIPDYDEIRRYCPYCYEKDFKTTKLSEECIRVYNKQEKRTLKHRKETYVPVRVEEWKSRYRNECCGKEYEDTWEHKIDLRD
ncbi:hypothetical protein [Mucispirillum schaedleri]|uniref:hypothetical protein n=1 Tax=Mucispirillum schaedleri TaxID=248039 RepID=UPI001F58ECA2|nr:hypothetical protein [Mucispirillum schaedleri]